MSIIDHKRANKTNLVNFVNGHSSCVEFANTHHQHLNLSTYVGHFSHQNNHMINPKREKEGGMKDLFPPSILAAIPPRQVSQMVQSSQPVKQGMPGHTRRYPVAPPLAAKVGVLDGVGLRHYTAKVSSSSGVDELVASAHGLEHGVASNGYCMSSHQHVTGLNKSQTKMVVNQASESLSHNNTMFVNKLTTRNWMVLVATESARRGCAACPCMWCKRDGYFSNRLKDLLIRMKCIISEYVDLVFVPYSDTQILDTYSIAIHSYLIQNISKV